MFLRNFSSRSSRVFNRYTCILFIALVMVYYSPLFAAYVKKACCPEKDRLDRCQQHHGQFKARLAEDLQGIYHELAELADKKKQPKLLLRFEEILHRFNSSASLHKDSSAPLHKDSSASKRGGRKRDVCPEVFQGTNAGYPYYEKGWNLTDCTNAKPIKSVVSILINTVKYSEDHFNRLNYVLEGIHQTYPTTDVLLTVNDKQNINNIKKYDNMKLFKQGYSSGPLVGRTWNTLIKEASTPYVLIARDIIHFSWLAQIERQIRVVSELPHVGVAGGSYRNHTGHWEMGCYQSTMKNYVLEYQEGYLHSRNECMVCDYLQGPFVVRKSLVKFDETISDEVVFEDLFLTLGKSGTLTVGCPDAMYFTMGANNYVKKKNRDVWLQFSTKWVLNRVLLPRGIKHSFSCKDIGFKCNSKLTRSYLLPVCCQEQYEHALVALQDFTNMHNISFELDTGSVLGTVKYNGFMPWDIDGDVRVLSTEIHIFNQEDSKLFFKKRGLRLNGYEKPTFKTQNYDGYINIKMAELNIEVWGRPKLTCPQFLPKDLQNTFTLARVRGSWVKTVFSPGLFVRNRYGFGVLKHSQSWRMAGLQHSYSDYKAGEFLGCAKPDHHACLQHFPADGDIPFLVD